MPKAKPASGGGKGRFVSGFVSILGRPNAGKSTLLNALAGAKIAIVSSKPQTTRHAIQGVVHLPGAQIVFVDTPGIHDGERLIHKRMRESVRQALDERDVLLWLADAAVPFDAADLEASRLLGGRNAPVFLVLTKIDALKDKRQLLPKIEAYRASGLFQECFPVSARTGDGLEALMEGIVRVLPKGPRYFPDDFLTDQPERHLAAELIRERALVEARQEVPHAVAVVLDAWEESPKLIRMAATIVVEREGQKKILIGAGGSVLKRIGTEARKEMEALFGRQVFVEIFVKVRPGWRESAEFLNELDWQMRTGGNNAG